MKTAIVKSIDGVEFICGFDSPVLDPEATKQKVREQLVENEDFIKLCNDYSDTIKEKENQYKLYYEKCKTDRTVRSKASYDVFLFEQEKLQNKLRGFASEVKVSRDKSFLENLTYFVPKTGEHVIGQDEFTQLMQLVKKLKLNERINLDGETVQDNRKRVYYQKNGKDWDRKHVLKFGDKKPDDGFYIEELSDLQKVEISKSKENKRIRSLSDEAKQAEMDALNHMALHAAAIKMNEFELSGEINPKEKAQAWLEEEKAKIAEKYSI